jgi:hypothetical protein
MKKRNRRGQVLGLLFNRDDRLSLEETRSLYDNLRLVNPIL